tara:strand:+ start:936 stop:1181 length:246 start_codon:yes stop_codon:yes gene_type:complete
LNKGVVGVVKYPYKQKIQTINIKIEIVEILKPEEKSSIRYTLSNAKRIIITIKPGQKLSFGVSLTNMKQGIAKIKNNIAVA